MFYAKDEHGNYILASERSINSRAYCPECNAAVLIKRSNRGRYFFVHSRRCTDGGGESDAHLFWKRHIYKCLKEYGAQQEVVLPNQRRADLLVGNTIVEIQFSNIRIQELKARISDYKKLGFHQYWLFKFPRFAKRYLTLAPMMMYIWKDTLFPLLYIDFQSQQLLCIQELQVISRNKALYKAVPITWLQLLTLPRKSTFTSCLQQGWLIERERQLALLHQRHIQHRTVLAKQLYYLKAFGYTVEHFGIAYTGNHLFTVSPFVWQIQLIYMKVIQNAPFDICCDELKKIMIVVDEQVIEQIVLQVLEQFLALIDDARCHAALTKK